jgi:hypothetical protein
MDNIKIVRLQSGEDVIANYTDDEEGSITLVNPMSLMFKRMPTGRAVMMMSPWLPLELVEDNVACIYAQDILSVFQPKQSIIDYYNTTVTEVEEDRQNEEMNELHDLEEDDLEMSVEEEQEAMEELKLLRQDIKKKLLH